MCVCVCLFVCVCVCVSECVCVCERERETVRACGRARVCVQEIHVPIFEKISSSGLQDSFGKLCNKTRHIWIHYFLFLCIMFPVF